MRTGPPAAVLDTLEPLAVEIGSTPFVELVRPLLRVTHAELATELRASGLPYAIDPTNAETRYRRNALRGPLDALRAEFPHLDRAVARCAEIVRATRGEAHPTGEAPDDADAAEDRAAGDRPDPLRHR